MANERNEEEKVKADRRFYLKKERKSVNDVKSGSLKGWNQTLRDALDFWGGEGNGGRRAEKREKIGEEKYGERREIGGKVVGNWKKREDICGLRG
jgi:hypothetical protein